MNSQRQVAEAIIGALDDFNERHKDEAIAHTALPESRRERKYAAGERLVAKGDAVLDTIRAHGYELRPVEKP